MSQWLSRVINPNDLANFWTDLLSIYGNSVSQGALASLLIYGFSQSREMLTLINPLQDVHTLLICCLVLACIVYR